MQRNTTTDLIHRPCLQASRELKKLSKRLTQVHYPEGATRSGKQLNARHEQRRASSKNAPWPVMTRTIPSPQASPEGGLTRMCAASTGIRSTCSGTGRLCFQEAVADSGVPMERTTNRLEVEINSLIKHMRHHGLLGEGGRGRGHGIGLRMANMKGANPHLPT